MRNPRDSLLMKSQLLIKVIRDELEITTCIKSLIFGKFLSMKEQEEEEKNKLYMKKRREENISIKDELNSTQISINDENFDAPLHRIKVFNQIKKILLRMTRHNGLISLGLLNGLLIDLRCKMNVEIFHHTKVNMSELHMSS